VRLNALPNETKITHHWRGRAGRGEVRLAAAPRLVRQARSRVQGGQKNCNNNKDGDEKTLHAMGLTKIGSPTAATAGPRLARASFDCNGDVEVTLSRELGRPAVSCIASLGQTVGSLRQ
jgi:hypothetical protein